MNGRLVKPNQTDFILNTNLLIEPYRPLAEGDAVTEAVFACGATQLPIQPDVLALGVRVEAGRL